VQKLLGGTKLLDQDFTLANLQEQLQNKSYPVVHIATHGKFGVDAASTFLLTFDSRMTLEQIDEVLREAKLSQKRPQRSQQPVELLTLSACQTAAGDNRAALGIAGVAVRAGVRSALASLWNINDEATVPLIEEFYTQLEQPQVTKAEALQTAQLKMINHLEYSHPAVWSPFILIGNWL
jgi:CHAT domain-containing protein